MRKLVSTRRSGIYLIKSTVNDKIYIGSAINLLIRKRLHLSSLRIGNHGNKHMQNHFNKHGDVLEFFILRFCCKKNLIKWEQYYMDSMNSDFNICKIAGSSLGVKHSKETRLKNRMARLGKKQAPRSPEHCAKISKFLTGRKLSDKSKAKMRERKLGENHWRAKFTSEQVSEIKRQINNKIPVSEISKEYKVSYSAIKEIKSERNWAHIEPRITNKPKPKLSEDIVRRVKIMLEDGVKQSVISKELGVNYATVSYIYTGKQWSHVTI